MKLNMWRTIRRYRGYCLLLFSRHCMHSAMILALLGCIMGSARLKLITAQTPICVPRASPVLEAEEVPQWKCSQYSSHNLSWCPAGPVHTACTMFPSPGSSKTTLHAAWLIAYRTPLIHVSVPIFLFPLPSLLPCLSRY